MKYKCDYCGKPTDNIKRYKSSLGTEWVFNTCDECRDLIDRQYDWEHDNEHIYESNIICPYCDYEFDDYDSYSYVDEGDCDVECPVCGKTFNLAVKQTVEFSTHKKAEDMPEDWEREQETDCYDCQFWELGRNDGTCIHFINGDCPYKYSESEED